MQPTRWEKVLCVAGGVVLATGGIALGADPAPAAAKGRPKTAWGTAQKAAPKRAIGKVFQVTSALAVPVDFWRAIYSTYSKDQVVIHDTERLDIVYDVVDLTDLAKRKNLSPIAFEEEKRARVREAKGRVRGALHRLDAFCRPPTAPKSQGKRRPIATPHVERCSTETLLALAISPLERKIVQAFSGIDDAAKFAAAMKDERLRSQTGQKDKFLLGIQVSGRYLPMMEKIFKEYGIPWEITRLVFVESMFNLRAYSRVGASGLWQFMPGTARLYGLTNDDLIDERNDPLAATHAAARLLQADHAALGAWPLAINAYNAGRGRLLQAVQRMGTRDIGRIIHHFDHPGYGFASRNFYPEFLAALEVYENYPRHFGAIPVEAPLDFEALVTTAPVPFPELAKATKTSVETLQALNPGYTSAVVEGTSLLPPGYTLKVPPGSSAEFLVGIDRIGRELTQRGMYVVQKGETLPTVATKVGVSQRELRSLNRLRGSSLTPGQILRLPVGAISAIDQ